MRDPDIETGDHLDPREISAYLDERLPEAEKERVQTHLFDCSTCRAEVAELVDLLGEHERRPQSRWRVAAGIAAAAGIALLVGVPALRQAEEDPDVLRLPEAATERESVRSIPVVSPDPSSTVSREAVEFAWEPMGEGVAYRLTITDPGGVTVWAVETDDTIVEPPAGVGLRPGETYLWYVDAVLPDGTTATTGVKRLRIAP